LKKRLDALLLERGLAATRQKAQALVMAGSVLVGDVPVEKPGKNIEETATIRIRGERPKYVSRGALKLLAALDAFGVKCEGRIAMDIGASTGGFTQVLLERGAGRVYAVDAGTNQLDWRLRCDPQVVVMEKTNARYLEPAQIPEKTGIITVDVSFISIAKLLPALMAFFCGDTDLVALIKPQFEVGRDRVGKGGIVRSEEHRLEAVKNLTKNAEALGLARLGLIESPITGMDGNKEYLAHWKLQGV